MVYCGKPSKGCQVCRTRRIKCDETKPTCLQCQKSRRQCPGYKNDFDLVFRNETQATERRARRAMAKGSKIPKNQDQDVQSGESSSMAVVRQTPQEAIASSTSALPITFEVPIDQQAFCYFLSNFVSGTQGQVNKGFMTYLLPLLRIDDPNSCLTNAFSAVSMASLANRPNSKAMLFKARSLYSKCLISLNQALRDPVEQLKDETLASVLLMSIFEQMLSMKTNITAWGSHTEGAVQLVRMRGKKRIQSPIGRAMFNSVRSSYIVHCMCAGKSPEFGSGWWTDTSSESADPVYETIQQISLEVCEIRTELNKALLNPLRTAENLAKVAEIMQCCNNIDRRFEDWINNVPESWQYKTVGWVEDFIGTPETSEVCPGRIDVYSDVWIASVWNYARVARMFLSGIMLRCVAWICAPNDYRATPEYAAACVLGAQTQEDIVASLPFCYGYVGHKTDLSKYYPGFATSDGKTSHARTLGAFLNVWPTFSVCNSDYTTEDQRRYCMGRLKYTTEELGVNQAQVLSHFKIRLPSMSIKRDGMALMAAYAANVQNDTSSSVGSPESSSTFTRGVSPTSSISSVASPPSHPAEVDPATREAFEKNFRKAVDKTREDIIKEASNELGANSEQILQRFLALK